MKPSDPEQLADYTEGKGFLVPINIMIFDANGDAARVVLSKEGPVWAH